MSSPENRPRVVVVKPVILCDDDGRNSARHSLPKAMVDRVYTKAGLEFLYLEPIRWRHGKARRGEINLDQIVREGLEARTISRDRRVVTLLFVTAVDGRPGPLGRGQQNGNICFVSLGPKGRMADPAERAFVVAHEIGHCLNLIHAVDDPAVSDDIPNLQGDGPFEDRLAVAGLHDSQRNTVLRSPLVLDRKKCHRLGEGRRLISDESWEPYISQATDDMLRFSIGLEADAPLPAEPDARRAFARQKYAEKVVDFTSGERKMLRKLVTRLKRLTDDEWPVVSRLPWHFIKVDSSFCNGMPHTRGLAIVLPKKSLKRIAGDEEFGLKLLLHEKLHVVQRLNGHRFTSLYEDYGFREVKLAGGESERLNLVQNPDALRTNWGIGAGKAPTMLVTRLVAGDAGKFEFQTEYRAIQDRPDGFDTIGEVREEDDAFRAWRDSFPLAVGHDHPNETSAYLGAALLERDFLGVEREDLNEAGKKRIAQTRRALRQALRFNGE